MSGEGVLDHDILSIARDLEVHNYLHMLAISCLYYDHCVTLTREIEYLWAKPKSQSSYWFFLNRYFAFLANLSVTVLGFSPLSESRWVWSSTLMCFVSNFGPQAA
ncbi:hypothetical protein BKA70DRAFT_252368 [Coprinopsis sp. MPI-PUGE-AT-0042]|nr:hypothetical protein BKA70DRAFT_252368 [Coprinopsis sp. MPI-PUGE-AT-0042]